MKMEWLVVKGVCGFVPGSATKNNSWKTFACVMAASVVSNMLSNSFVFGDWPHYGGTCTLLQQLWLGFPGDLVACFPWYRILLSADENLETNSGIKYIGETAKHSFEVMDDALKLQIRGG